MAKIPVVDSSLETEGVWVPFALDIEFKLARAGTAAFNQYARRISKPHRALIDNPRVDTAEIEESIVLKALAQHVVKDWRNLEDDDGPIPFSKEKAQELLEQHRDLFIFVLETSKGMALFVAEEEESDSEN
jgi:hypothetical protein